MKNKLYISIYIVILANIFSVAQEITTNFEIKEETVTVQNIEIKIEDEMVKDEIKLSTPQIKGLVSIEECISKRRSFRQFENKDLNLEQISQLLWAGQGITDAEGKRSAPSAGALYPIDIYLVISSGIYHYIPKEHKIKRVIAGDFRSKLSDACLGQSFITEAGMNIVIAATYRKTTWKYGTRGIRYVDMEAGHIAENLQLQAVALGLGSVPIGSFNDKQVKDLLILPTEIQPIYLVSFGFPR